MTHIGGVGLVIQGCLMAGNECGGHHSPRNERGLGRSYGERGRVRGSEGE